jgi:ketosteroid isomerase-like protein
MSTQVAELVAAWAEGEAANDAERVGAHLAEDFVGVGPVGFVLNREQWLARFAGGLHNDAFVIEDVDVHDHGGAAFVVGVLAQQTTFGPGQDNSGRFRITIQAVRGDAGWRITSVHIGMLGGPMPGRP